MGLRRIMAAVLMALLLPLTASADGGWSARQNLTDPQQALFDQLHSAAEAMEPEVSLPADTAYADVQAAMDALYTDCPELISLSSAHSIHYYRNEPEVAVSVTLQYTRSPAEDAAARQLMESAITALVSQAEGATDWDRALALHDALCDAVTYDLTAPHAYDAYGALVEGRAACEGYAEAYTLLCRASGIPCATVSGTADNGSGLSSHAWNLLTLDSAFCYVDATWDDQDDLERIVHWYFGLSWEEISRDHIPTKAENLPQSDSPFLNWHVRKAMAASADDDEDDLQALFLRQVAALVRDGIPVDLRMATDAQYQLVLSCAEEWLDAYSASAAPGEGFYGAYVTTSSPTQRCFLMDRSKE